MNASLVGLCEFSASHVDLPMPIKQFFYVIDHLFDIIRNICLENDLPIPPSAHIRSKSWNAGDFSKSMVKEVNEAVVQEHVEEEEEEDNEEEILVVVSPVTNEALLDSFQSPTVSASSFFLENMSKILAKIPDTFVQYLGHRARTVHLLNPNWTAFWNDYYRLCSKEVASPTPGVATRLFWKKRKAYLWLCFILPFLVAIVYRPTDL